MAEQNAPELAEANSEQPNSVTEDMELEATEPVQESNDNGETNSKRAREEGDGSSEENDGVSKKQKVGDEKSVEEERLEKKLADKESGRVSLGPKSFGSSVEMFDYFYKFLHYWPPNLNVNKVRAFGSFTTLNFCLVAEKVRVGDYKDGNFLKLLFRKVRDF